VLRNFGVVVGNTRHNWERKKTSEQKTQKTRKK
jgi:hypothetical protein